MGNQKGKLSVSIGDDASALPMVDLPIELWELILMNTDAKTLAIAVPRVCKLMNELSARDPIWKFKYVEEYKPDTAPELKDDLTWKKMYFRGKSILFPLYGVYIGKTTKAQLKARSDAKDNGDYFTLEDINFWMHSHPERDVFNGMYIARGIYIIPPSWEKQGITWKRSYDKYKKLLKQLLGNVSEPYAPRHREWQGQQCFQGELTSIASEGGVQYEIKFGFDYTPGDSKAHNTLYNISVMLKR
jgi:hypothetical protein